ncbi:hypothetical protein ILYODFUR_014819 [Ilyodon furcidens]|uniref:Uncharacterized protein n=1 Tax=Ilyodon furcidens TaxID=33524 RepID=A0ABV0T9G6_9TELE
MSHLTQHISSQSAEFPYNCERFCPFSFSLALEGEVAPIFLPAVEQMSVQMQCPVKHSFSHSTTHDRISLGGDKIKLYYKLHEQLYSLHLNCHLQNLQPSLI